MREVCRDQLRSENPRYSKNVKLQDLPYSMEIRVSTGKSVKQEALGVLRRLMGDSERGLASPTELKKITYSDLRAALITNYTERGNKSLAQRADGTESIVGLPQLDKFFGYEEST